MRKYLFVILIVFEVSGCKDEKTESGNGGISLSKAMSDTETGDMGFEKAVEKRKFTFPDDHGPHPDSEQSGGTSPAILHLLTINNLVISSRYSEQH